MLSHFGLINSLSQLSNCFHLLAAVLIEMYYFIVEVFDHSSMCWCQRSLEEPALDIAITAGGSDLTSYLLEAERQTGG